MITKPTSFPAWIGVIALVVICVGLAATHAGRPSRDMWSRQAHRAYARIFGTARAADPGIPHAGVTAHPAVMRIGPAGPKVALFTAAQTKPRPDDAAAAATAKLATFPETTDGLRALAAYARQIRANLAASGDARGLSAFNAAFRRRDITIARAALPGFTAMLAALPPNRRSLATLETIPEQYGPAFVALPPDLQQRYAIALAARHDAIRAVITQQQAGQTTGP